MIFPLSKIRFDWRILCSSDSFAKLSYKLLNLSFNLEFSVCNSLLFCLPFSFFSLNYQNSQLLVYCLKAKLRLSYLDIFLHLDVSIQSYVKLKASQNCLEILYHLIIIIFGFKIYIMCIKSYHKCCVCKIHSIHALQVRGGK